MGRKYSLGKYGVGTYDLVGAPPVIGIVQFNAFLTVAINLAGQLKCLYTNAGALTFDVNLLGQPKLSLGHKGALTVPVNFAGDMRNIVSTKFAAAMNFVVNLEGSFVSARTTRLQGNITVTINFASFEDIGPAWGPDPELPDNWAPILPPSGPWAPISAGSEPWTPKLVPADPWAPIAGSSEFWNPVVGLNPPLGGPHG